MNQQIVSPEMSFSHSRCYLQLCLSSHVYFITLIKRTEDLHSAHIHVYSIS